MTFIKNIPALTTVFRLYSDDLFAKELFWFTPTKSFNNFAKMYPVNILETEHEFKIEVVAGVKRTISK